MVGSVVRPIAWAVVVIVAACFAPTGYHSAFAAYYRYRVNTTTESAMKSCGGPITDSTSSYQKDDIAHCMAADAVLNKAKEDYDNFTKGDKH
jgi:hypothetical protein